MTKTNSKGGSKAKEPAKKKTKKKAEPRYVTAKRASELTGLPLDVLIRMRSRPSGTLKSSPPFRHRKDESGNSIYDYPEKELRAWIKKQHGSLTKKEAAMTLGVQTDDLQDNRTYKMDSGDLIVYPRKNLFIWVGKDRK